MIPHVTRMILGMRPESQRYTPARWPGRTACLPGTVLSDASTAADLPQNTSSDKVPAQTKRPKFLPQDDFRNEWYLLEALFKCSYHCYSCQRQSIKTTYSGVEGVFKWLVTHLKTSSQRKQTIMIIKKNTWKKIRRQKSIMSAGVTQSKKLSKGMQ